MLGKPSLQYVGSCDTASGIDNGSVMFKILFDASINLLMFEFLIQYDDDSLKPPESIVSNGFIHTDTCIQTGIVNQYLIPIVADANNTDSNQKVQIRVYDSTTGQCTEWSDSLTIYNPPAKPEILSVYYDKFNDSGYYDDVLFVLFSSLTTTDAIVSYYYTSENDGLVHWEVTAPTPTTSFTYVDGNGNTQTGYYIQIPLNDDVDLGSTIQVVSHAVYEWTADVNSVTNTYHAISEVSNSKEALPAEYDAPVLNSIDYLVYTTRAQEMTLNWTAPVASLDPFQLLVVDHYLIYVSVNGDPVDVIDTRNANTSATVNVGAYDCGSIMSFTVSAVSSTGVETEKSDSLSENIFRYPGRPTELRVGYVFYDKTIENTVDMLFSFKNPIEEELGCGEHIQLKYQVFTSTNNLLTTGYKPYVAGTQPYLVAINALPVVPAGTTQFRVEVSLGNQNTNSDEPDILYGEPLVESANIGDVPIITDISSYGNVISFTVTTGTLLDLINNIVLVNVGSSNVQNWKGSRQVDGGNVVSVTPDPITDVFVYRVEVEVDDTPDRVIVNAANNIGIGHAFQQLNI